MWKCFLFVGFPLMFGCILRRSFLYFKTALAYVLVCFDESILVQGKKYCHSAKRDNLYARAMGFEGLKVHILINT